MENRLFLVWKELKIKLRKRPSIPSFGSDHCPVELKINLTKINPKILTILYKAEYYIVQIYLRRFCKMGDRCCDHDWDRDTEREIDRRERDCGRERDWDRDRDWDRERDWIEKRLG